MRAYIFAILILMPLGACSILDTDVQRGYAIKGGWHSGSVFTTADVRIITQRVHPGQRNEVVCAEPSPDVAKALSSAASLAAQGGSGGVTAGLNGSGASSEALAELAGRSTALLGLRDGLFRACEAYANGAIGQDMYGLVVSRYTQLMTTLFLGQDITAAAGAEGKAQIASSVVSAVLGAPANAPGGSTGTKTTTVTTTPPAAATPMASTQAASALPPIPLVAAYYSRLDDNDHPPLISTSGAAAAAPAAADAAAEGPAADAATPKTTTTQTSTTNAGVSDRAALALVRMNEDYIHEDVISAISVSCVNEYDPTRYSPDGNPSVNKWLRKICDAIDLEKLQDFSKAMMDKFTSVFIDPTAGMVTTTVKSTLMAAEPAPVKVAKPAAKSDPTIKQVQMELNKKGCAGCAVATDGFAGPKTTAAVKAYQTQTPGLTVNGDPKDPATLKSLGITRAAAPAAAPAKIHHAAARGTA